MKLSKEINSTTLFLKEKVPEGRMRLFLSLLFIFVVSFSKATENNSIIDSANAEYAKGKYSTAIQLYEKVINEGQVASELYYNLGNAYFKSNNIAAAILNYERAKKLNPDDEDIAVNLKLANQQIEDKIEPVPQLFLTEWKNDLTNSMTEKGWSIACIFSVLLALSLFTIYFSSQNGTLKRIGFFGGATLLILGIFLFFTAKNKYNLSRQSTDAIITSASVTATGSPSDKGTKLFILHEGTKVNITQEEDAWTEIKLANGNVGWIKSNSLTSI